MKRDLLSPGSVRLLLSGVALCLGGLVWAGPNAGGVLNVHDANLTMSATSGSVSLCGQGLIPDDCGQIDCQIDGASGADPSLFKVYAAFPYGSSPRLMGLTWGVHYPQEIVLTAWGTCGSFELNDPTWPQSDTGSSVTWDDTQTGLLTPVYWFAAYLDGTPAEFSTRTNPDQGGWFGDDSVPAVMDLIAGYGSLGFDMPGTLICVAPPLGACCDGDGNCTLTMQADCQPPDHYWMGPYVPCDPNPCHGIYGACCAPDCSCTITVESGCLGGSIWLGPNTVCDPNPCDCPPPIGVCCHQDLTCTIGTEQNCTGVFHQEWTTCDPNPCIFTPVERTSWGRIKADHR